jgi:hypothetical protein
MEDSMIAIAQSTIETANKNAAALAESVRASYDGDATDFEGFVDMLFSMFYITSAAATRSAPATVRRTLSAPTC